MKTKNLNVNLPNSFTLPIKDFIITCSNTICSQTKILIDKNEYCNENKMANINTSISIM